VSLIFMSKSFLKLFTVTLCLHYMLIGGASGVVPKISKLNAPE